MTECRMAAKCQMINIYVLVLDQEIGNSIRIQTALLYLHIKPKTDVPSKPGAGYAVYEIVNLS